MRLRESASALTARCYAEVLAGRYRLDALIGSGGAADVHRGFDLRLRRPVAVKVFRPGADTDMEERFRSEAVILARLQHPGLVTAYDAGRHNGRAYLVMQLVEGPTLKGRIAGGPLSSEETAALGTDLAEALAHAHEAGIVHRDVKPSNIILDASGHPHLTDFGISRLLDATTRTATGTLIGTAAYLSPEQVLGRSVSLPADIYALGLVLLECLTGRLEYGGGPLEAAIARLHRRPALPDSLPEDFATLLRNMTALDERERPTARECARTLTALARTADSVPVPSAPRATSVAPGRGPVRDAEPTHPSPLPAGSATGPKAAAARRRTLIAGGTAALAAVLTTVLALPDGPSDRGSGEKETRAAGRTSAPADPPHTAAEGNGATSVAPSSSIPDASAEPPRDASSERSPRSAPADPIRNPAADTAPHGTEASTPHSHPDGAREGLTTNPSVTEKGNRAKTPGERPGRPETAERGREGAQKEAQKEERKAQKGKGKTAESD
ncbi:serine/threonine protein kinase [Streptomyces griseomycini]|uniref:protein kinase domain-containing protein n=1 Tax=Streptomyces griseomycini TaxID=66895 RepID=UPI00187359A3|nr:protein kinase [Streptomyces griseomycini]GGQ27466.1 serine/threonine protein kinase [Streptomyces griseomycini]